MAKALPIKCGNCGVELPQSVYEMDKPWEYECVMCGKPAFAELKDRIVENNMFNLADEVDKVRESDASDGEVPEGTV